MLIQFSVGNFRSFSKVVTLSLTAEKLRSKQPRLDEENVFVFHKHKLLKSIAIYGANASGKSNLIRAFGFMRSLIINSSRETQADEKIKVEKYRLNLSGSKTPAFFETVFLVKGTRYRYGFEVNEDEVKSEWLYYVPKAREAKLFEREYQKFSITSSFKEGLGLEKRTRKNSLFLSVVSQFNGTRSLQIYDWFKSVGVIHGVNDLRFKPYTISQYLNKVNASRFIDFIKQIDVGIKSISIEETTREVPKEIEPLIASIEGALPEEIKGTFRKEMTETKKVITQHTKYDNDGKPVGDVQFDIEGNESEGTRKLFFMLGPIFNTLDNGEVLFIDEIDARLHPLLTREIVNLFNSNVTNKKKAQLVFVTHDTSLLDKSFFRRDQIWFVEKNKLGASDLYSLAEMKIRNDAAFEKDYILGKYGAIPFLGDLDHIFGD